MNATTKSTTENLLGADVGKRIYSKNGVYTGVVLKISSKSCFECGKHRHCCAGCDNHHICYVVQWDDGKVTNPCTSGVKYNLDGSLTIQ